MHGPAGGFSSLPGAHGRGRTGSSRPPNANTGSGGRAAPSSGRTTRGGRRPYSPTRVWGFSRRTPGRGTAAPGRSPPARPPRLGHGAGEASGPRHPPGGRAERAGGLRCPPPLPTHRPQPLGGFGRSPLPASAEVPERRRGGPQLRPAAAAPPAALPLPSLSRWRRGASPAPSTAATAPSRPIEPPRLIEAQLHPAPQPRPASRSHRASWPRPAARQPCPGAPQPEMAALGLPEARRGLSPLCTAPCGSFLPAATPGLR